MLSSHEVMRADTVTERNERRRGKSFLEGLLELTPPLFLLISLVFSPPLLLFHAFMFHALIWTRRCASVTELRGTDARQVSI